MEKNRVKNYKYGIIAEYISCILLFFKGYTILARRYKNHLGEIDIIALKHKTLVFIEVKARKKLDQSVFVLSDIQRKRIEAAAKVFIMRKKIYRSLNIRFDMITFSGWLPSHKKNMW